MCGTRRSGVFWSRSSLNNASAHRNKAVGEIFRYEYKSGHSYLDNACETPNFEDASYVKCTKQKTSVSFDEDGTVLSETEYPEGTPAADIEKPADPTKPADDKYTYTFAGWTPEIADVTGDATYTATYDKEEIKKSANITYNLGGGTYNGSTADIVEEHTVGEVIKIHEAPTKDGFVFVEWQGSSYDPGDKYDEKNAEG